MSIVLAYHNKWSRWMDYWFYHRVCSDEDVAEALANDLPKAHILVSQMVPMEGLHLAKFWTDRRETITVADAFTLISRWQISRDLVEEWLACESPPLSGETRFFEFKRRDGYVYPNLGVT